MSHGLKIFEVRTDAQLSALHGLVALFAPALATPEALAQSYSRAREQGERLYGASIDGKPVGSIGARLYPSPFHGLEAYVGGMIIHPDQRHTKIAPALIEHVEAVLAAEGVNVTIFGRAAQSHSLDRVAAKAGYDRKLIAWTKDRPENFKASPPPPPRAVAVRTATTTDQWRCLAPLIQQCQPAFRAGAKERQWFEQAGAWNYRLHYLQEKGKPVTGMVAIRFLFNTHWAEGAIADGLVTSRGQAGVLEKLAAFIENRVWLDSPSKWLHVLADPGDTAAASVMRTFGLEDSYIFYRREEHKDLLKF